MISRLCATTLFFTASHSLAVDLTPIPSKPIAEKKELLFSDDFEASEPAKVWHKVVPTFVFEKGVIKGTQTRDKDVPATDTKPIIKAHAAVHGLEIPTKDSVVEVKIRFEGASMIDVEFDDRKYKGSHYGHLSRARVHLDKIVIMDEREGSQNEVLKAMRLDPAKQAEAAKQMAAHNATFPLATPLEQNKWYHLTVETIGEEMRVILDGKPVAFFKSPGIGHATKSKIELGVAGQSGWFDEIKVWNAEPAK